eukprot:m.24212 g.24212  ORF g.24212 m.24212 type:complete len:678 (+) comp7586_c0_seq1:249-2282(+)
MADWSVQYFGKQAITGVEIVKNKTPDLREAVIQACKDIRKSKSDHINMKLSMNQEALVGLPEEGGAPLYQPVGKIVYILSYADQSFVKKSHMFSFVSSDEDSTTGDSWSTYTCYMFKCKNDSDIKNIEFAAQHTMMQFKGRGRPVMSINEMNDVSEIDSAVAWWNACKIERYQLNVNSKTKVVTGVLKFQCNTDADQTISKIVRITSDICGAELVQLLADKFNLTDINHIEWAVFVIKKTGEPGILDEEENPIVNALQWKDPSEGEFMLKKLPKGLQRVAPEAVVKSSVQPSSHSVRALGPVLPYSPEQEDLLLSVMIKRQSGSSLGFKLTPSYLLQMCIAYCVVHQTDRDTRRLVNKISESIVKMIDDNLTEAEILLFWTCNTLKLIKCFGLQQDLYDIYCETARSELEGGVELALKSLLMFKEDPSTLPAPLSKEKWSTVPELRQVITNYCDGLEASMTKENLQDVVDRITAAMPTPQRTPRPKNASRDLGGAPPKLQLDDDPNTSTLVDGEDGNEELESPLPAERPGIDPLPEEWEELVDQETKHRFFANHITRQTSWTDPRDKLITVTLSKGSTGLGLGISGAKRTWDDRLILGIFVSSLVPNSAAAMEGTLREGDEILEVNGHSLIGVSREGAIDFLKQVKGGDSVVLLVSQEPETWTNPANEKAALRHTAL